METEIICSSKLVSSYTLSQRYKIYYSYWGIRNEVKRETNPYAVRQKWRGRENGERWKYCIPSFKDSSIIMADISDLNVTLSKNTAGLTHHSRKYHLLANLYIWKVWASHVNWFVTRHESSIIFVIICLFIILHDPIGSEIR